MFRKEKKHSKTVYDTSIEGYKKIGINLTQEQFDSLCNINMIACNDGRNIPVHTILLVLKHLGLLPSELVCEVSDDKAADNAENIRHKEFQQRYGFIHKRP